MLLAGVTADILKHLSGAELAKTEPGVSTDRVGALASHVIGQRRCAVVVLCVLCVVRTLRRLDGYSRRCTVLSKHGDRPGTIGTDTSGIRTL